MPVHTPAIHYDVTYDNGFVVTELDSGIVICTCPSILLVQQVVTALEAVIRLRELRQLGV